MSAPGEDTVADSNPLDPIIGEELVIGHKPNKRTVILGVYKNY